MSRHEMVLYGKRVAMRAPDVVQLVGVVCGLAGAAVVFGGVGLLAGGVMLVLVGWVMRAVRLSGGER